MTRLAPVVWSEGMHLAQHHFQAQSRYFEESIRFTLNQLCFQAAGFASVGLDQEALLNGVATLGHARGIMPDGTPFQIPEADPAPESLDVRPLFGPTEHQRLLYLTLPPLRPGAANCATDGDTDFRYSVETLNLRDETTGLEERPVTVGRKNFTLALKAEDESIDLAIPLARIRREGSGEFRYDSSFIPPCIQIGGSPRLLELLAELLALLERKAQNLRREGARAGDMVAQYGGEDLASFWLSHAIHSGMAPLRYHLQARRSHPEAVFLDLIRLAGALCTFSLRSGPDSVPTYDHGRLEDCFSELDRHIRSHLEVTLPTACERVSLQRRGVPSVFTGTVREDLCSDETSWILGVRSEERASRVVSAVVGKVKLASKTALPDLVRTSGMAGIELEHLTRPPRELAPRVGWEYFLVRKTGSLWKGIRDSLEVGVWIPDEIIEADLELAVILKPAR